MAHPLSIATAALPLRPVSTVIVYAGEGAAPTGEGGALWAQTGLDWAAVSKSASFAGKQGQVLDILAPPAIGAERLLVLGRGKQGTESAAPTSGVWRDRGGSLAGKLTSLKVGEAAVILDEPGVTPEGVAELVAGLRLRHYSFEKYKSPKAPDDDKAGRPLNLTLYVPDPAAAAQAMAARGAAVDGTLLARDLVNEPPNKLGPEEFAERARGLAALGLEVEVLTEAEMRPLGMEALLAVGQGSARPARLVIMRWNGAAPDSAPLAFVGKGVVFDSGGISIKPAAGMEDMKGDMGGAAAVTGLMQALASRKAAVNAVGILAIVENMPDGDAMRPGDILKAMSGTTIEIVNTDAEGRLALADALWYAQTRFSPRLVIDLATLTGAIVVALGHDHAGLYCNNDELAAQLYAAGLASGEKLWRMPLGAAYDKLIESRFADIKNSGGRPAGSITAAQFLQRFVKDKTPWAHLDIAGTAMGGPGSETNTSWGPGFGVALLDQLVRDAYEGRP